MDVKHNGGPAFPQLQENRTIRLAAGGMTLRDWFAGQALAGMKPPTVYIGTEETKQSFRRRAQEAYLLADAMLAERDKASKDAKAHEKEIAVWSENYAALEHRVAELVEAARESAMQELASLGQAQEAYEAQLSAEAKVAELVEKIKDWEARIDDCEWSANSSLTEGIRAEMLAAIRKGATP